MQYDRDFTMARVGDELYVDGYSYKIEEDVDNLVTIKNFEVLSYEHNKIV
jgi:hypothetical protein